MRTTGRLAGTAAAGARRAARAGRRAAPTRGRWRPAARARACRGSRTVPTPRRAPEPRSCGSSTVAGGLSHVWDLGFLPDGRVLVTERGGRLSLLSGGEPGRHRARPSRADFGDVLARGEGGLMGMVVHPDFAQSRRFTTCQTHTRGRRPIDVRLVTWELSADGAAADAGARPAGRRAADQPVRPALRVPTDASPPTARCSSAPGTPRAGTLSQDLTSLGGKVLRVDLATGRPAPDNPFVDAATRRSAWSGPTATATCRAWPCSRAPAQAYSAEHGPTTDDEVNLLRAGGNYGWDPSQGGTVGGYDESVPMTDLERFPDAVPAAWSSGSPVEAVAGRRVRVRAAVGRAGRRARRGGAARGEAAADDASARTGRWRRWRAGAAGRARSAGCARCGLAPDGALFVSTSNGDDDKVLRDRPGLRRAPSARTIRSVDRPGPSGPRPGPIRPHDQLS